MQNAKDKLLGNSSKAAPVPAAAKVRVHVCDLYHQPDGANWSNRTTLSYMLIMVRMLWAAAVGLHKVCHPEECLVASLPCCTERADWLWPAKAATAM